MVILCVKIGKNWFLRKNSLKKTCDLYGTFDKYVRKWRFWVAKQSLECISLQIFSKWSSFKITGSHQPPDLPTLKAYPTHGESSRFDFFSAKMRGKDEIKSTWNNFNWLCFVFVFVVFFFWAQGENCLGGCCNPSRRTRVNGKNTFYALFQINPRLPKGMVTIPLTVCRRLYQNAKQSDPGHLSILFYILCGDFDEKNLGIPYNTGVG